MDRNLNIFFDIDETLVQTIGNPSGWIPPKHLDWFPIEISGYPHTSICRTITRDLLAYARSKGNVFALTQGGDEYFSKINNEFKLGFDFGSSFTREDIKNSKGAFVPFVGKTNILIDNLNYTEQINFPDQYGYSYGSKVVFLDYLKPENYYMIPDFSWKNILEDEKVTLKRTKDWIDSFIK